MGEYSWLEVDEYGPGDVVVIIGLVEEDILAVLDAVVIGGELLKDPAGADAVLPAELLPKLRANLITTDLLWLPHWPIWMVIISRGISIIQIQIKREALMPSQSPPTPRRANDRILQ